MAVKPKNRKRATRKNRTEFYTGMIRCLPWSNAHKDEMLGWGHKHPAASARIDYPHDLIPEGSTFASVRDHATNFQYA